MASEYQTLKDIGDSGGGRNPVQETRFQELSKTMGSTGGSLMAYPDITLNDVGGSAVDFSKTLDSKENSAFNDYLKLQQSQPKPYDLYQTMQNDAGIPALKNTQSTLQGQIYDVEDTIRRLEPDIAATTKDSVVTEAQRRGMLTARRDPMLENLGWLTQSLGRVSSAITNEKSDITTNMGFIMQGLAQDLEPYKEKLSLTVDQDARAMTGFTADRQTTLDILLKKIDRNIEISDKEWQQAQDLAKEERGYAQAIQLKQIDLNNPANQITEAGGRKVLVNMTTGKVVADLGSTSSGTKTGTGITVNTGTTSTKPTSSPTSTKIDPNLYNYLYGGTQAPSATLKF